MPESKYRAKHRAKFNLTAHIVFVTKYRRKALNESMLQRLEEVANSVSEKWDSSILDFSREPDHIHFLLDYPPQKTLGSLIANMKSTMSKAMWNEVEPRLKKFYWEKRVLWTGAYFVASCGGVTIEQLKAYVESQERPDY